MLIKVRCDAGRTRSELRELVDIFRGRIVDVSASDIMIEISGRESKIEAFIERMRSYGIVEMVRTGRIAMVRGSQPLNQESSEEVSFRKSTPSVRNISSGMALAVRFFDRAANTGQLALLR